MSILRRTGSGFLRLPHARKLEEVINERIAADRKKAVEEQREAEDDADTSGGPGATAPTGLSHGESDAFLHVLSALPENIKALEGPHVILLGLPNSFGDLTEFPSHYSALLRDMPDLAERLLPRAHPLIQSLPLWEETVSRTSSTSFAKKLAAFQDNYLHPGVTLEGGEYSADLRDVVQAALTPWPTDLDVVPSVVGGEGPDDNEVRAVAESWHASVESYAAELIGLLDTMIKSGRYEQVPEVIGYARSEAIVMGLGMRYDGGASLPQPRQRNRGSSVETNQTERRRERQRPKRVLDQADDARSAPESHGRPRSDRG